MDEHSGITNVLERPISLADYYDAGYIRPRDARVDWVLNNLCFFDEEKISDLRYQKNFGDYLLKSENDKDIYLDLIKL